MSKTQRRARRTKGSRRHPQNYKGPNTPRHWWDFDHRGEGRDREMRIVIENDDPKYPQRVLVAWPWRSPDLDNGRLFEAEQEEADRILREMQAGRLTVKQVLEGKR
mgnify:CR=1 FL=1